MRTLVSAALIALALTAALRATPRGPVAAPFQEPDAAAMQAWMQALRPGEHHAWLEPFVGTWKTTTRYWMGGPGSEPVEVEGTAESRWVLGKRFVEIHTEGQVMGMPNEGISFLGYDNHRRLYVGSMMSTLGTHILTMSGSRPPGTDAVTMYGEMDEPGLVTGRTVKFVRRLVDADTHVLEMVDLHAGDDYKVVEVRFERAE